MFDELPLAFRFVHHDDFRKLLAVRYIENGKLCNLRVHLFQKAIQGGDTRWLRRVAQQTSHQRTPQDLQMRASFFSPGSHLPGGSVALVLGKCKLRAKVKGCYLNVFSDSIDPDLNWF